MKYNHLTATRGYNKEYNLQMTFDYFAPNQKKNYFLSIHSWVVQK